MDQEFLDACKASVVLDLSRFGAGQNAEDGRVPSQGVAPSEGFNDGYGFPFGGGVAL